MTNNKKAVPQAKQALNQMKLEIANELGLSNYESVDKGNLTARQNGYVGGNMTKKLVEMAQQQMANKNSLSVTFVFSCTVVGRFLIKNSFSFVRQFNYYLFNNKLVQS